MAEQSRDVASVSLVVTDGQDPLIVALDPPPRAAAAKISTIAIV